MRRVLVWLAVFTTAACTFTRDLDYLHDAPASATTVEDAGTEEKDAAKPPVDAAVDSGPVCASGTVIAPTEVVPFAGVVSDGQMPQAVTCNPENILANDGKTTNLDRYKPAGDSDGKSTLAGQPIAGCIGVRFDRDIETLVVKLAPIGDGCGVQPCNPDPAADERCGTSTGWSAYLFAGVDEKPESMQLVKLLRFTAAGDTLKDQIQFQTNDHPPIPGARVAVVCRNGNVSIFRDDVAVDAIWDECK